MFLHVTAQIIYQLQRGKYLFTTQKLVDTTLIKQLSQCHQERGSLTVSILTRCNERGTASLHGILVKQVFTLNLIMGRHTNPQWEMFSKKKQPGHLSEPPRCSAGTLIRSYIKVGATERTPFSVKGALELLQGSSQVSITTTPR